MIMSQKEKRGRVFGTLMMKVSLKVGLRLEDNNILSFFIFFLKLVFNSKTD